MPQERAERERSQRLARLLRHEVCDLLQSVYSTVAILSERLPPEMSLERRLARELKNRAELCRNELDAAVALASDAEPRAGRTDLAGPALAAFSQVRQRFPALLFDADSPPTIPVLAEADLLPQALNLLLIALGQSARHWLRVRFTVGESVEVHLSRDGYPVPVEQLGWIDTPFLTTHHAVFGLGLALARRAIPDGEVRAENANEGGVSVWLRFPFWKELSW